MLRFDQIQITLQFRNPLRQIQLGGFHFFDAFHGVFQPRARVFEWPLDGFVQATHPGRGFALGDFKNVLHADAD